MSSASPARWTTAHVYGFEKYAASGPRTLGTRRRTIKPRLRVGSVTTTMLIAGVMGCLAVLSLLHNNQSATRGYKLRSIQGEHEELTNDTKVLRMRVAELQALKHLNAESDGMVVAGAAERVKVEQRVALK